MLALVLIVTLGQCTKDIECKGDRICVSGECRDSDAPRVEASVPLVTMTTPAPPEAPQPAVNPYRVHRILGTILGPVFWAATVAGSLAIGDQFWPTTVIPIFGPLITYLRVTSTPGAYFIGDGAPILLFTSLILQAGALAYMIGSVVSEANFTP